MMAFHSTRASHWGVEKKKNWKCWFWLWPHVCLDLKLVKSLSVLSTCLISVLEPVAQLTCSVWFVKVGNWENQNIDKIIASTLRKTHNYLDSFVSNKWDHHCHLTFIQKQLKSTLLMTECGWISTLSKRCFGRVVFFVLQFRTTLVYFRYWVAHIQMKWRFF